MGPVRRALRRGGVAVASADDRTIPPEIARQIVDKLLEGRTRPVANKIVAQQALNVFESLNTRPPGWGASLLLVMVQGGALLAALVATLVFVVAQRPDIKELWKQAQARAHAAPFERPLPKHAAPDDAVAQWQGERYHFAGPQDERTIVATFDGPSQAAVQFKQLSGKAGAAGTVRHFADTVFVSLPADAKADANAIFDSLSPQTKQLFIEAEAQGGGATLHAVAASPEEAAKIRDELQEYFAVTNKSDPAVPPWRSTTWNPPEQYAQCRFSRRSLILMRKEWMHCYQDPEFKALATKMGDARRRRDTEELKHLTEQQKPLLQKIMQDRLKKLADLPPAAIDHELLAAMVQSPNLGWDGLQSKFPEDAKARLGMIPPSATRTPEAAATALYGSASGEGRNIELYASFTSSGRGLPALTQWLREHGCTQIRYDLFEASGLLDED